VLFEEVIADNFGATKKIRVLENGILGRAREVITKRIGKLYDLKCYPHRFV